jgi:glycosyltransferase involved in cell wall biosynthesis
VDVDRFRAVPRAVRGEVRRSLGLESEFAWLAVGRYEVAKDYPTMLRAFARVREQITNVALVIVGRGSLQKQTERLAGELGLGDSVRFTGVRSDVPEVMSAADAYVLSSAWEGMPMVLLEAGAAGLPIVATRVGGNDEVVLHGQSGFLVPCSDAAALGDAMLRLHRLPESERSAMGERGRDHIRTHYSLSRVAERWESLYREVLARKGLALTTELPAG